MGTCRTSGVDTLELIEIRNSINKQNECIQAMMSQTQSNLKEINDKICRMEKKQLDSHDELNISSKELDKRLSVLSAQIASRSVSIAQAIPDIDGKENVNQANLNSIQRFPKPRVVKFYSQNTKKNRQMDRGYENEQADQNDSQLNAINLRMNSMRSIIRNSMSKSS